MDSTLFREYAQWAKDLNVFEPLSYAAVGHELKKHTKFGLNGLLYIPQYFGHAPSGKLVTKHYFLHNLIILKPFSLSALKLFD